MQNVLFTYRRRVKTGEGEGDFTFNDNFVNPLNVISFYWQVSPEGKKILSVWLVNNYSLTFSEQTGQRFVDHMEDFLRYMLGAKFADIASSHVSQNNRRETPRKTRTPITTDVVEDEAPVPQHGQAQWEG